MFTSTDAPVMHIKEPKKGIPCKYYLRRGAVVFIDHRHKKRKENKRKLRFIIIITLKVTTIIFSLFDKVLLFIHVTIKKRERKIKVLLNVNKTPTNSDILCFIAKY